MEDVDEGVESDDSEGGEMDDDINQCINDADDQDDTDSELVVFIDRYKQRKQCFILSHLRVQGDSLRGACAANSSKFDLEDFENFNNSG